MMNMILCERMWPDEMAKAEALENVVGTALLEAGFNERAMWNGVGERTGRVIRLRFANRRLQIPAAEFLTLSPNDFLVQMRTALAR